MNFVLLCFPSCSLTRLYRPFPLGINRGIVLCCHAQHSTAQHSTVQITSQSNPPSLPSPKGTHGTSGTVRHQNWNDNSTRVENQCHSRQRCGCRQPSSQVVHLPSDIVAGFRTWEITMNWDSPYCQTIIFGCNFARDDLPCAVLCCPVLCSHDINTILI